jgi:hypothetical protein
VRGVELNVTAPEAPQLPHLVAKDVDNVGHEVVEARVRLARPLRRPQTAEQAGRRQRDLRHAICDGAQECELLRRKAASAAKPAGYRHLRRTLDRLVPELLRVPVAPQPGVEPDALEAVRGGDELRLERLATQLAVGNDRATRGLLEGDDVPHRGVLDRLELSIVDGVGGVGLAGLDQLGRAQEAPYVFGAGVDHRAPAAARRTWNVLGPIRLP